MRAAAGLAALLVCKAATALHAAEDGASATGSLAWIASDRLDMVGSVAAELPLATIGAWRVFSSAHATTAIEKATSNFTFLVDQVGYRGAVGARRPIGGAGSFEVFAAEQGFGLVDNAGSARVRVIGAAWESADHNRAFGPFGWAWRASLAAVLEDKGISAAATATGEVRYLHAVSGKRRVGLGASASVDALFGKDHGVDVSIGPRLELDLTGDRRMGVFVSWLHSDNPLGLHADGVLAGFDFAEGLRADGPRLPPPEISGRCVAGAGEDRRGVAELAIRVVSPPFLRGTTAEIEVGGSILTASDLNDLFYEYDVGIAHGIAAWRAGVFFHHRSNHVWSGFNAVVTSIDVLEAAFESDGWNRSEPGGLSGKGGALDARIRAGWLIDSSFGEDTGWHLRAGARWSSPELKRCRLYLAAEAARGDVAGSTYTAGALLPRGWDIGLQVRHDEQLFTAERRAHLALATLRY